MKKLIKLYFFIIFVAIFYLVLFDKTAYTVFCNSTNSQEYIEKSNIVVPSILTAGKVDIIAGKQIDSVSIGNIKLSLDKIDDITIVFLVLPVQYTKKALHITIESNGLITERDIPVIAHENTLIDVSKVVFSEATAKIKSKENEEQIKAENIKISKLFNSKTEQKFSFPFKYPVETPTLLSLFGKKRNYYNEKGKYLYSSYHYGVDLRANNQTDVLSAAEGKVVFAYYSITRGNAVYIDHGLGIFTSYFHLDKIFVKEGELVAKGLPIAKAGTTGLSTAEHLHWGVIINSTNIDGISVLELNNRFVSAKSLIK